MKKRYTEEQIIGAIREHEAGAKVEDICRSLSISSGTFYNWRSKYAGLEVNEAKRLRELETVNEYLKPAYNLDSPKRGEWGYTTEDAVIFERPPSSLPIDYVAWEWIFAEKRVYSECIVFRPPNDRFSGIKWKLQKQRLLDIANRKIDELTFAIQMLADNDFEELKNDWEKNDCFFGDPRRQEEHIQRRSDLTYWYTSVFFFDVTQVIA